MVERLRFPLDRTCVVYVARLSLSPSPFVILNVPWTAVRDIVQRKIQEDSILVCGRHSTGWLRENWSTITLVNNECMTALIQMVVLWEARMLIRCQVALAIPICTRVQYLSA
jgi:hypothetical protein